MKPDSIQFIHFLSLTAVLTLMILSFWIGKHAPLLLSHLTKTKPKHSAWASFQSMKGAVEEIGQKLDLEIHLETRTLSWKELIQLDSPALLETVWEGTIGHSTAYLGSHDGHAILGEPLTGRVTVDENSLKGSKWNWNGVAHVFVMRCPNN